MKKSEQIKFLERENARLNSCIAEMKRTVTEEDCRNILFDAYVRIAHNMRPLVAIDKNMTVKVKDGVDVMIKIYKFLFPNSNNNSNNADNDRNNYS